MRIDPGKHFFCIKWLSDVIHASCRKTFDFFLDRISSTAPAIDTRTSTATTLQRCSCVIAFPQTIHLTISAKTRLGKLCVSQNPCRTEHPRRWYLFLSVWSFLPSLRPILQSMALVYKQLVVHRQQPDYTAPQQTSPLPLHHSLESPIAHVRVSDVNSGWK